MPEPFLKGCPFCGGKASFTPNEVDFVQVWGTSCDDCGVWMDSCLETKEEAAEEWNKRVLEPEAL